MATEMMAALEDIFEGHHGMTAGVLTECYARLARALEIHDPERKAEDSLQLFSDEFMLKIRRLRGN